LTYQRLFTQVECLAYIQVSSLYALTHQRRLGSHAVEPIHTRGHS